MLRGCFAGPCPEQVVGTGSHGAELQTVTPAMHPTTAAAAERARFEDLDRPSSAVLAVPQEQTETSGGEEGITKR